MNNSNFIKHLDDLSKNRFALDALDDGQYLAFYTTLLAQFTDHLQPPIPNHPTWYLLGTDGCHLCDIAHNELQKAHTYQPLPPTVRLDITNAKTPLQNTLIDTIGKSIPVLITPHRLLCYPFSMMDIIALLDG